jgi:hypothetical protein
MIETEKAFATPSELVAFVRRSLSNHLQRKGKVFYSGFDTYIRAKVVFLGFNPGGSGEETLEQRVSELPADNTNHFVDQHWDVTRKRFNVLQTRSQALFTNLGLELRRDVFTSNLYFQNTPGIKDTRDSDFAAHKEDCWKVVSHFIAVSPARVVICNGNQTYFEFLTGVAPHLADGPDYYASKEMHVFGKRGKVYASQRSVFGRDRLVVGLPHLSWVSVAACRPAMEALKRTVEPFLD